MSPIRPCPYCGKPFDFHEDELDRVADGSAVCLECGLKVTEAAFILEVVSGEHPELVDEILGQEEEEEENDD